eukprot:229765_1
MSIRPVINLSKEDPGSDDFDTSTNGNIKQHAPEKCTVKYVMLRSLVATAYNEGPTCHCWARDCENGYMNLVVREAQRRFGAFRYCGMSWIPIVMTFGCTSAPHNFTRFMAAVLKAMRMANTEISYRKIRTCWLSDHLIENEPDAWRNAYYTSFPLIRVYVDDIMGFHKEKAKAWEQYHQCEATMLPLNINPKYAKDEPPAPMNELLGANVHCDIQFIRMPHKKCARYIADIREVQALDWVPATRLNTIRGRARHAMQFERNIAVAARNLDLYVCGPHNKDRKLIKMSNSLYLDLEFLIQGMIRARDIGVSFEHFLKKRDDHDTVIYTDAAKVYGGIGGYIHEPNGTWFQSDWDGIDEHEKRDIQWKELMAVLIAIHINKQRLRNKVVQFWCDNEPVVGMLRKLRAKLSRPDLQFLLLQVASLLMTYEIMPDWQHIAGDDNDYADKLSRFLPVPKLPFKIRKNATSCKQVLQNLNQMCINFEQRRQTIFLMGR